MPEHYCANCRFWAGLADTVYCAWCLEFFYGHSRMPLAGETLARETLSTLDRLYVQLGWRPTS